MGDDMVTPDEWDGTEWVPLHVFAQQHDHKGHSEEMCVRCGWIMGQIPLNCQNDNTPHVFPSQQAEIERLRAERDAIDALHQRDTEYYAHDGRDICFSCDLPWPCQTHILLHPKKKEACRG